MSCARLPMCCANVQLTCQNGKWIRFLLVSQWQCNASSTSKPEARQQPYVKRDTIIESNWTDNKHHNGIIAFESMKTNGMQRSVENLKGNLQNSCSTTSIIYEPTVLSFRQLDSINEMKEIRRISIASFFRLASARRPLLVWSSLVGWPNSSYVKLIRNYSKPNAECSFHSASMACQSSDN